MKFLKTIANEIKAGLLWASFNLDVVKNWTPKVFGTHEYNLLGRLWVALWSVVEAILDAIIFVMFGV